MSYLSGLTSLGHESSALRFGLIDIRPIKVKETFKRWGMKFRRHGIKFEPLKPTESYTDFMRLSHHTVLSRIILPEKFERRELVELFTKASVDRYEKDKELQNVIKELRQQRGKYSIRPLTGFVSFMKDRFETNLMHYFETEAERFMKSNFPLSFFGKLTLMNDSFVVFLQVIHRIVRRYEILATLPGTRDLTRSYKKCIADMKKVLVPLIDQMDECSNSYFALKLYVNIWNAKSYDDVRDPEFLDVKAVKHEPLVELKDHYQSNLSNIRRAMFAVSQYYAPEAFKPKIEFSDPTARMLGKLLVTCPME